LRLLSKDSLSHTFLPVKGGLDLIGVELAGEPHCLDLDFDERFYIVMPKKLSFYSFAGDEGWSYFWLDTGGLEPISEALYNREEVYEIASGVYVEDFDEDEEFEENYPRLVVRCLEGKFVIFAKASAYNANPATYDARHNLMSEEAFRQYIADLASHFQTGFVAEDLDVSF
jgi:hypothetical protein